MKYLPKQRIYSTRHNCYCIVIEGFTRFGIEYYKVLLQMNNPKLKEYTKEITLSENNLKSTQYE